MLFAAAIAPVQMQYALIGGYVLIEAIVEFTLFRGRQEIWVEVQAADSDLSTRSRLRGNRERD
jgi:hypothetical protein